MNDIETLWQEMAELTFSKCRQKCRQLGSCCELAYCEIAKRYADEKGVNLLVVGGKIPYLDNQGHCSVPPRLRPLCTLHQCNINGLGFCPDDPEWTRKYFNLRETLETMEDALSLEVITNGKETSSAT